MSDSTENPMRGRGHARSGPAPMPDTAAGGRPPHHLEGVTAMSAPAPSPLAIVDAAPPPPHQKEAPPMPAPAPPPLPIAAPPPRARGAEVLTDPALAFAAELHRRFGPVRDDLLARRKERRAAIARTGKLGFLPET